MNLLRPLLVLLIYPAVIPPSPTNTMSPLSPEADNIDFPALAPSPLANRKSWILLAK
jgi:hypothetical protein